LAEQADLVFSGELDAGLRHRCEGRMGGKGGQHTHVLKSDAMKARLRRLWPETMSSAVTYLWGSIVLEISTTC
jgi:hypothetical protein